MSDALERISRMARVLVQQADLVTAAEVALAAAKEAYRRTETEDLPQLMKELELTEIKLTDGSKVSIVEDVQCSLSEERRAAGLAWLEANGFGGLVKTEVAVAFGRGEADQAREVAQQLASITDHEVTLGRTVHAGTLKSFVKEQMALAALPAAAQELFAVYPFARAKLTAPKAKATPRA
jgi:hypothetical protein